LSILADAALAWGGSLSRDLPVAVHEGRFDEEFTDLFRGSGPRYGACVRRFADYLNWRYLDHPVDRHHVLTVRRNGRLAGYSVVTLDGDNASLVDLFGVPEDDVVTGLIKGSVGWLRRRGGASVSFRLSSGHPWAMLLRRLGFRPRESSSIVMYSPATSGLTARATDPARWFVTGGDRDA
jgi:hypothetical protein